VALGAWSLAYAPGVGVFRLFPGLPWVGVSSCGWWRSLLLSPCTVSLCVADYFTVYTVGYVILLIGPIVHCA